MSNDRKQLTAKNLKAKLWDAIHEIEAGRMTPSQGETIARHSREIVRLHMAQLRTRAEPALATPEMLQFVEN